MGNAVKPEETTESMDTNCKINEVNGGSMRIINRFEDERKSARPQHTQPLIPAQILVDDSDNAEDYEELATFPQLIPKPLENLDNSEDYEGYSVVQLNILNPFTIKKNEFEEMVNFSDIKKGDIYVNLIHYDKNMKNNENFEYYRYFSVKIMGDYFVFDDFNMLKLYISKTNQIPETPSYILMASGSDSLDVLNEFHNISFITDIIIFCYEVEKYVYLKEKYTKIKLITKDFREVRKFLLTKRFSDRDLNMDNHL